MNIKKRITQQNLSWLLFILIGFLFILLLLKNPFSERNLISNLEPYPDSIHYISPSLSFIRGKGFYIEREGRIFMPTVPFLYSLTLAPGYLINNDARFFYFTNIILALSGFLLFYFFLLKISSNRFIALIIIFIYSTNYFVYWYPNLPMAENLVLTLFNAGLFLLTRNVNSSNMVAAGFLAVSFYGAKYANFTLSGIFAVFYFLKVFIESGEYKNFLKRKFNLNLYNRSGFFILCLLLAVSLFFLVEYLIRGESIFFKIKYLLDPLLNISSVSSAIPAQNNSWFSYSYFNKNFDIYSKALLGDQMRFLWDFTPLLPRYIAVMGLLGLGFGIWIKKTRLISAPLISFTLLPILFLSTFYSADSRYIYHVIPSLLSGFAIFLSVLYEFSGRKNTRIIFYLLLIFIFVFYSISCAARIKYQIALNLRHTETPWNYISVKTFNEFFASKEFINQSQPVLISALPPYYVDFLQKSSFKQLPLSSEQEFTGIAEIVWGDENYSDYLKIYKKYLDEGRRVFVTNASLGNTPFLHRDFDLVKNNFTVTKVKEGCLDTCNIYELKKQE